MTNQTSRNEPIATLAPGTILGGKYELLEQIGRGGMGVVWKAKDRVADRLVALKFVPKELQYSESEMNRVRAMFKKVHALQHQSICALYGLEDGGHVGYYLVMRFLEGETLARYVERTDPERKGLPPNKVIPILSRAAWALDYAHRNGVIHRDIDPSNIFLVKTDQGAEVQIIDFGLAETIRASMSRISAASVNKEDQNTIDPSGTCPYMAPEQWRGRQQTAATDQYSLAVTAYELLAGHLPFEGNDLDTLYNAVLNHPPEPIPPLSKGVNAVLLKALAKQGADRFTTCEEFIETLSKFVALGMEKESPSSFCPDAAKSNSFTSLRLSLWERLIAFQFLLLILIGGVVFAGLSWGLGSLWKSAHEVPQIVAAPEEVPVVQPAVKQPPTATTTASTPAIPTPQPADMQDGWVEIFDGKTLNGWRANGGSENFRIENGCIVGLGKQNHLYYIKELKL